VRNEVVGFRWLRSKKEGETLSLSLFIAFTVEVVNASTTTVITSINWDMTPTTKVT